MGKFPAWNNLKHFNYVSTVSFTDGQSFYDILKVIQMLSFAVLSSLTKLLGLVHTSMYCAAPSSKLISYTLHSSISMLPNINWSKVYDQSASYLSSKSYQRL